MRGGIGSLVAALGASLTLAAPALAVPTVNGEFDIPGGVGPNNEITAGPDGNMWVTRQDENGVARITPAGAVTPFDIANTAAGIAVGPDGNLWVTTAIGVTKIPPGDPAADEAFNLGGGFAGITAGPDGNMWAVSGDDLVRFSTADPVGSADPTNIPGMDGKGMATGSDGLIWIADGTGRVHSATAADTPTVTTYTVGAGVQDVAAGLNAQVGYAAAGDHEVGLLTPPGPPQRIALETSDPFGIAFGADGAYWVARSSKDDLLRLTPDGQTSTLTGFSISGNVGPRKVAAGPNNTLWVTLDEQNKVARVTGVDPASPGTTEPETTIDKRPKKRIKTRNRARVKFKFSSSDPAATFECKLKRKRPRQGGANQPRPAQFKPCASPKKYRLKPAKYRFQVRAVVAGVADASPAKFRFKVVRKE